MLCFLFAVLVVLLDQFFKRWIVITFAMHEGMDLIPGVIGLTRVENPGASFGILSAHPWILVGIACFAVILLIAILLRYNDGFWGTLGLAAVLGGTVGNLIDRLYIVEIEGAFIPGKVVDMFELQFVHFAIFNVADIFITLGGLTFIVFFIITTIKSIKNAAQPSPDSASQKPSGERPQVEDEIGLYDFQYGEPEAEREKFSFDQYPDPQPIPDAYTGPGPEPPEPVLAYVEQPIEAHASMLETLSGLETEFTDIGFLDDYDVDKLLREYGFEDDTN